MWREDQVADGEPLTRHGVPLTPPAPYWCARCAAYLLQEESDEHEEMGHTVLRTG